MPAELEAIVLACLSKQPDHRPQSAAELRRKLQSCGVAPWDDETAGAWWAVHEAALAKHVDQSSALARAIAVDGASRVLDERRLSAPGAGAA